MTVGYRHGLELGRLLEVSMELCCHIAGCVLHVELVQAKLGEEDDSFTVLVGAWTVGWTSCWVFPKLCSTEALTRT